MQDTGLPSLDPTVRRVGLFGGAFDPVHLAHLWLAQEALRWASLDLLFFIPCRLPPHKPSCFASEEDRVAMLELGLARSPRTRICNVELTQEGPSYTVRTLRLMREAWGEKRWVAFLLGGDAVSEIHTWRESRELVGLCDALLVAPRPCRGLSCQLKAAEEKVLQLPEVPFRISSTMIRRRVSEGAPIRYLVPEAVERYIAKKELYLS